MKPTKLGIWMDHDHAYLIEFVPESLQTRTIPSAFKHESKENHVTHGEDHDLARHNRHKSEYYKGLGDIIRNYQEVLLFGPTNAKTEFLNTLAGNQQFSRINIQIEQSDKMTKNQMQAFVRNHFLKN